MLSLEKALLAVAVMALIVLACRALPFLFFARRKPPAILVFVEENLPPVAMTVLAVSSFTSIQWRDPPHGLPELIAGAAVVAVHVWKRNALLSIFGGTALYMVLSGFVFR